METNNNSTPIKKFNLLVVECQPSLDWFQYFKKDDVHTAKDGTKFQINVDQGEWDDMTLVSYGDSSGCVVSMRRAKKPLPDSPQFNERTFKVDFVLMRSVTRALHHQDSRNLLWGFVHANVPCVNSLQSLIMALERPIFFGGLRSIQQKLGKKNFPLIEQNYYPNYQNMIVTPEVPIVAKVGHAHAGFGKIKLKSAEEIQDFRSLAALHPDYFTLEPFIKWDYDARIQKIGNHYRAFKRVSQNWKGTDAFGMKLILTGNVGHSSIVSDMELTEKHKMWIDECSKLFGGLDICALDLLHSEENDQEYILELNDTAIGLVHAHADEDMTYMRDLVVMRMAEHFFAPPSTTTDPEELAKKLQEDLSLTQVELQREKQQNAELQKKLAELEQELKKKKKGLFG